jgi:hypothetical protein
MILNLDQPYCLQGDSTMTVYNMLLTPALFPIKKFNYFYCMEVWVALAEGQPEVLRM